MSRVWKKFLYKLTKVIAVIAYMLTVMAVPGYVAFLLGEDPGFGVLLGGCLGIIFPMLAYMLRDLYRDCKQEVEWENRKMMSALKGGKIDY